MEHPSRGPAVVTHDNSMMDAWSYCERLYALQYVLHRRPVFGKHALGFGGIVHVGLGEIYNCFKGFDADGVERDVIGTAEVALTAMDNAEFEDPEDDYRTRDRAKELILHYLAHWKHDVTIGPIEHVETAHDVDLHGMPWGGIIDLWTDYKGLGLHIIDHKTTSRYGPTYWDQYYRSAQMIMYLYSAAALLGVWPQGVVINLLVNREKGSAKTPKFEFHRKRFDYKPWIIQEVRMMHEENYEVIQRKREKHQRESDVWDPRIWKPNFYNCTGKYGKCRMYDVCHSTPENREQVLLQETEEHKWDWKENRNGS